MFEYNTKVIEKRSTISQLVDETLRTLLQRDRYRYLDENGRYYRLDYDEFEPIILDHLLKCKNPCDNIKTMSFL